MCIGRRVDTAFNRHVDGVEPYSPSRADHRRLGHVVRALRAAGITPLRSQVPLRVDDVGIRTVVDAIGVRNGAVVVIELKSTAYARADHEATYDTPSYNNPRLANGFDNSERQLHRLQAGFGVAACRAALRLPVVGVVVVAYAESARVHAVPPSMCNLLLFAGVVAPAAAVGRRRPAVRPALACALDPWPHGDERVDAVVSAHGGGAVERVGEGSVVVRARGGRPLLVAGCVRGVWAAKGARERRRVVELLRRSHHFIFGSGGPRCVYVLHPHTGSWRLRRVDHAEPNHGRRPPRGRHDPQHALCHAGPTEANPAE